MVFKLLMTALVSLLLASSAYAKKLRVLAMFPNQNTAFDGTAIQLTEGIHLAKSLFEKQNPGDKVVLDSLRYAPNLSALADATKEAIRRKHIAVIGGQMSGDALVLGELLGKEKIVFITPTSSTPKVTKDRPFVFRMCFSDDVVSEKLAKYTLSELKPKALGVIHNISAPYSNYLTREFLLHFDRFQGSEKKVPVHTHKVLVDEEDFTAQIEDFIKAGVSHVLMLTYDADLKRFVFQASKRGFFPTYIGSDGLGSNDYLHRTNVTESPFGAHFKAYRNNYWNDRSQNARIENFKKAFREKFRRDPTGLHAIGFDTAWLLFSALKQTPSSTGKGLRQTLINFPTTNLVTNNKFKFGRNNSPQSGVHIYRIDKDGIHYEQKI